jgi:hypothetical protein
MMTSCEELVDVFASPIVDYAPYIRELRAHNGVIAQSTTVEAIRIQLA